MVEDEHTARCPDWPPPDGEPIGPDRARLYVEWIRDNASPVLAEAEAMLAERHPGSAQRRSSVNVEVLATWSLAPEMRGLCIGTVWTLFMAGTFAMVDIVITREGELIAKPGLNMRDGLAPP